MRTNYIGDLCVIFFYVSAGPICKIVNLTLKIKFNFIQVGVLCSKNDLIIFFFTLIAKKKKQTFVYSGHVCTLNK